LLNSSVFFCNTNNLKYKEMIIPQIKFVFDRKHLASNIKKGVIELRITFLK